MKNASLLLILLLGAATTQAQYSIDSTFNATGTNEFTQYAGNIVNGSQVAYTPDNNLVVAGRWISNLSVWKYGQDGNPDQNFGQNGMTSFPLFTDSWVLVKDIEIQSDGKILVLADEFVYSQNFNYCYSAIVLARLLPNGDPDSTFNGTGILVTHPDINFEYTSRCLSIDPVSNEIYVGGWAVEYGQFSCPAGTGAWFVCNFTPTGSYDLSFNSTGFLQDHSSTLAQFSTQHPVAIVLDLLPLPGNKLFFAGILNNMDKSVYTAQLNADGSFDNNYSLDGRETHQDPTYLFPTNDLTYAKILEDKTTLFHAQVPSITNQDSMNFQVHKFTNIGIPDVNFGINGIMQFDDLAHSVQVEVDEENRLIYAYYNLDGSGTQHIVFRRFHSNGQPDLSFGTMGNYNHIPVANETYIGASYMTDMTINPVNDDLTLTAFRFASYAPTTYRILNYHVNSLPDDLSTNELAVSNISLYPNPGNGNVIVDVPFSGKFTLIQSNGVAALSGNLIEGKNNFDWSEKLANGIYFLQIEMSTGETVTVKVAVEGL